MRNGHPTISDVLDYLSQFDADTIVVLEAHDTAELPGAISLDIALELLLEEG